MAEDKGFRPSRKKLEKAEKDGNLLRIPALTQALTLTTCILVTFIAIRLLWVDFEILLQYSWVEGLNHPETAYRWIRLVGWVIGAPIVATVVVGLLFEFAQSGFRLRVIPIELKLQRINPAQGVRKIFTGIQDLWLTLLKVVAIAWIAYDLLGGMLDQYAVYHTVSVLTVSAATLGTLLIEYALDLIGWGALVLVVGGAIEYLVKRRRYFRELSMSRDELHREHREDEGDPHMRSSRRALHQALSMQDLASRVRKAKVIVIAKRAR
jgi:type III secretion protein U